MRYNIKCGKDNVNGKDPNIINENPAAHVPQMPELIIPDGVDATTANLLKMQMTMMQIQLKETRERQILAMELAKGDSGIPKIVGKAPKFDMEKDWDNFET